MCACVCVFLPATHPSHAVTVFCHKAALNQRNANTELKELVRRMPSRDIILLVRDESESVCGKHLGFYLRARPTHCPTAENLSSQEHFQKLDFMHEAASKGTSEVPFFFLLPPLNFFDSHLDAIFAERIHSLLILLFGQNCAIIFFIDNPYFAL